MKIYPQTAPEIPTGESSIGWEAGEPGWATVPPHHPPRGSRTVSANSPGSPGLRKQGLGPWREGRVHERGGWSGRQHGLSQSFSLGRTGRARPGSQPRWRHGAQRQARGHAQACTPGGTCLALVPSYDHCFRRGSPEVGVRVRDAKALGEVASSFKYLLGQPPCCLDGTIIALEGQGRGKSCSLGQESRKGRAAPLHPQELWQGTGPWKLP